MSDIQKQIAKWAQDLTLKEILDFRSKRPLKCTKTHEEQPRAQQPPSESTEECSYRDELI